MRKRTALTLAIAALAAPQAASAAAPAPFGHACGPQAGVRLCPTASDSARVPTFDGVPIDVDVTLPTSGDGPFPTIVMLHGYGGSKTDFESATGSGDYNNVFYARRGYAVVNLSARGFGRSCGVAASRTAPACDRGWIHLGDQRYEARDVQYLLGLLVDEGVTRAGAIGVTGISYGGGQSQILARLRDRVRLADGRFVRWRSPGGTPLSVTAAWPRWSWSDLTYALTPNGRFLDFRRPSQTQSRRPLGVMKLSYVNGLYALGVAAGFVAPAGADPNADLTTWRAITARGEPYGTEANAIARELTSFHSPEGLSGRPAPLLLENGWTDDLFPPEEALRTYNALAHVRGARVSLQLGDLGHPRGSNKANADAAFNAAGARFFDAYLKHRGRAPRNRRVTAFTQTCPKAKDAGGPFRARSWTRLHPGVFRFGGRAARVVTSRGGNPATGKAFDQVLNGDACLTVPSEHAVGTAVYQRRTRRAYTLLGLPTISARIKTTGSGGQLVARLWDVSAGRQLLVSRGVYRLRTNQSGRITFQLFGNGWAFRRGHVAKLELVGSDPNYLRPSNGPFSVRVSKLVVELPTRDKPSRRRGIGRPRLGR
jgi:predicted acyl esterase